MWVGVWDLLTEGRVAHAVNGHTTDDTFHLFWTRDTRNAVYALGGWLVCVWADSITRQAGRRGTLWPPRLWGVGTRFEALGTVARHAVGLFGMVAAWAGVFDTFDFRVGRRHYVRDILFVLAGQVGVIVTRTLDDKACLYLAASRREKPLTHRAPLPQRLRELARCTVSFASQDIVWLGAWNLMRLDRYDAGAPVGYYLHFLAATGLLCLYAVGAVVPTSWVVTDFAECLPVSAGEAPTLVHYTRALVAVAGYLMWASGLWVLVDVHWFPRSLGRNAAYTLAGAALCYATNALSANIVPAYPPTGGADDGEADLEMDTVNYGEASVASGPASADHGSPP